MLSLTSQYALRALIYLARHECAWPITGQRIAEESAIPAKYLSKVLGELVRFGLLESTRGKHGGFRMVKSADETSLFDVLSPFESFEWRFCPFGNKQCSDDQPCRVHEHWQKILEMEIRFLRETTVRDVSTTRRPSDLEEIESGPTRK
jgi:Rrf2 family protein